MSDPHLNAVPLASSSGIPADAPALPPAVEPTALSRDPVRPLVEPLETFLPRLQRVASIPTGAAEVGSGWQGIDRIWAVGNGYVYGRSANNGDLSLWRHHGFLTGEASWTTGVKVGTGWGGNMVEVFAT